MFTISFFQLPFRCEYCELREKLTVFWLTRKRMFDSALSSLLLQIVQSTEPVNRNTTIEWIRWSAMQRQTQTMHTLIARHAKLHSSHQQCAASCRMSASSDPTIKSPRAALFDDYYCYHCWTDRQTDDNRSISRSIRRKNTKHKFQPNSPSIYLSNSDSNIVWQ